MKLWAGLKLCLKWALRITLVVIAGALLWFSPNIYHIYKWNPVFTPLSSHFYGEAETRTEAQADDIEFLGKLLKIDRSFSPESRAGFKAELNALNARAGNMSNAEFALGVAHAVALADNGHTNISQRSLMTLNNRLPVRFYWFNGNLHIVRAHPDHESLLGAEVIAFGHMPANTALARANRYFGGAENWRTYMSTAILESPALLEAAGIAGNGEQVSLSFRSTTGDKFETQLNALPAMESPNFSGIYPWMVLSDRKQPGEETPWASLADSWVKAPLYLSRPEVPFFFSEDQSANSLYVQVSFMLDLADNSIDEFWQSLETTIAGSQYDTILLDLRHNPGGDFNTSVGPVSRLPDHLTDNGHIYIATSRATFSAAIVNTSVAKYHAGERAVIIGERVGDRDQFWAEGGFPFRLPHSGLRISFATGFHDWVNGCMGKHPLCYDGNEGVENPISGLDPDVHVPLTFKDYSRGVDPVLVTIESGSHVPD